MPDNSRPTITQDHHDRYAQIMGTPVKSSTPTTQVKPASTSKVNDLLSSIPKPKGLGNKMFIFTGRKKIIMEGTQREVQNVKTVNAHPQEIPEPSPPVKLKEEKPEEKTEVKEPEKSDTEKPKVIEQSKSVFQVKPETDKKTKISGKKKVPTFVLAILGAIFLGAYTVFWLVFFGYISLG